MVPRKLLTACSGLFFIFCITASASAADISGTWAASLDDISFEITFTADGTSLTGKVHEPSSGAAEIKDGSINGDSVSFYVMRKLPGFGDSEFKISWKGEIIGDEILFKREFAGSVKGVIAKRAEASQTQEKSYDYLTGTWTIQNGTLKLLIKGTSITGTVETFKQGPVDIIDGKVKGGRLYFNTLRQNRGRTIKAAWEGEAVEKEIHFDTFVGGSRLSFIATRENADAETGLTQLAEESTDPSDNITGTWKGQAPTGEIIIEMQEQESSVTGNVTFNGNNFGNITDGRIDGDKIIFKTTRRMASDSTEVSFEGTVKGNEIHFTFTPRGFPVSFTVKKYNTETRFAEESTGPHKHLAGKWIVKWPMGTVTAIDFKIEDSSVSGNAVFRKPAMRGQIIDGKIEDNKISFKFQTRKMQMQNNSTSWDGTIEGDRIFFDTKLWNGQDIKLVAMREGAEEQQAEQTSGQLAEESTGPYKHLAGKWTAKMPNSVPAQIDLKVKDNTVTGSLKNGNLPMRNQIFDGKIEGKKISFKQQQMQMVIPWDGIISGDKIYFKTQFPNGRGFIVVAEREGAEEQETEKEDVQLPPTANPSGTWIIEINEQQYTIAMKMEGMSLSGIAKVSSPDRLYSLSDAKISGNTVSFKMPLSAGPNSYTTAIPVTGKVSGEEIRFEGAPFCREEDVIAKKIKGSGKTPEEREPVELAREETIKDKKVNKNYSKLRKKDREYDAAMEFFDKYQYHLALPLLEQVHERLPEDAAALHRLGVCLVMQSVSQDEAVKRKNMRKRARGLLEKSKKLGMEDELLDHYLSIIPEDGGENDIFADQEQVEEILKEAEKSFKYGDFEKCIVLYAKAMELDPTNYKAVIYVGDSYFGNHQHKEAVEWFERATKIDPDKETAWRCWGDCLMHLEKKTEGRTKFMDALIAEPYNKFSWAGVSNLIAYIRNDLKKADIGHKTPDIKRPQRIEDSGELNLPVKNTDDDSEEAPPDGTEAWKHYNKAAKEWRKERFKECFPEEEVYRYTLKEEKEALELVAENVNWLIKKGRVKKDDLDSGIEMLLELQSADLLEPYIFFHLADKSIVKEYPEYRKLNRDKLKRYLDEYELPKLEGGLVL